MTNRHSSKLFTSKSDEIRYRFAKSTCLLFFVLVLFATIVRPIFADMSFLFTLVGFFNSSIVGALYLLFVFAKPRMLYTYLVVAIAVIMLLPLLQISGGVNSQFALLIPVFPIISSLLVNAKFGIITGLFMVVYVVISVSFSPLSYSIDNYQYNVDLENARAFWLCLSTVSTTFFGAQFDLLNRRLSEKLSFQANIDSLTELNNRRCTLEALDDIVETAASERYAVSVLMIDVDHFKSINDTYGHPFGDKCLIEIAHALKSAITKEGIVIGRIGGEEFLVLLPNSDAHESMAIAQKIRESVKDIYLESANTQIQLSVTIGLHNQVVTEDDKGAQLIALADQALYKGKQIGRDCVAQSETVYSKN